MRGVGSRGSLWLRRRVLRAVVPAEVVHLVSGMGCPVVRSSDFTDYRWADWEDAVRQAVWFASPCTAGYAKLVHGVARSPG
jgi:hypothetical protein